MGTFLKQIRRVLLFSVSGLLLLGLTPARADRVIVRFQPNVPEAARQAIVGRVGAVLEVDLPFLDSKAISVPGPAIQALARRPGVAFVEPDLVLSATARGGGKPVPQPPPQPAQGSPWGICYVCGGANRDAPGPPSGSQDWVWSLATGAEVKVAVIDTGIDLTHPDLKDNIAFSKTFVKGTKSAQDDNGHGTHVAGTIAALNNNIGVVGVAPGASLYALKALNKNGSGWTSDIANAIGWCAANGIQVINMSLGGGYSTTLRDAVAQAIGGGIVVVAAAGNSSAPAAEYPAAYPSVIGVAATNQDEVVDWYSNYGVDVDIAAPGTDVYSTLPGGTYGTYSGTSMATPHIAGAAALLLGAGVEPEDVLTSLQATAVLIDGQGYPLGRVDARAAVRSLP